MRARLLDAGMILLAASIAVGCGDDTQRIPCCGDDVETPDETPAVAVLEPGQRVVADPTSRADYLIDFGTTAIGETARRAFPLQNTGRAPLHLSVGSPAAPFAIAEQPPEIAAGGTAVLRLEFEPTESGAAESIISVSGADRTFSVRLRGAGSMPALDCPEASRLQAIQGAEMRAEIRCANPTDAGFSLQAETTSPFVVLAGSGWVGPREEVAFGVVADTSVLGRRVGTLEITANAAAVATVDLELVVHEVPTIRCESGSLGFSEAVVGMPAQPRRIGCYNEGDIAVGPLEVSSSDPAFTATVLANVVPPGARFEIEVAFAPQMAGQYAAAIVLSVAGGIPLGQLSASGSAIALAPCELTVLPDPSLGLYFFDVQIGSRAIRELVLRSGDEACAIRDISVVRGDGVWSPIVSSAPQIILDAHAELRIPVEFRPVASGESLAYLHFRVSDPVAGERAIPLLGNGVDDCLTTPVNVRLASGIPGCQQWKEAVRVRNDCAEPLVFLGATAHDTGDLAPGFQVVEQPATPMTLAPGASLDLELAFEDASLPQSIQVGFTLAFEDRGARWVQATVGPAGWTMRVEMFVIPDPPVDTLFLRGRPELSGDIADLQADFVVDVDGNRIDPVYQGAELWTYDAAKNAIVFNEYFVPVPGSSVEVRYRRLCD